MYEKIHDSTGGDQDYTESSRRKVHQNPTDDITSKIVGDFGWWQCRVSLMMTVLKLPLAWYQLNVLFLAPPQDYWCAKPVLFSKYSDEEWRKMATPLIEEHPCLIFDPEILYMNPAENRALIPLVECPKFVYDKSVFKRTMVSEWDLVCSKHWLVHFSQVVLMVGILLGGIIFGILADKYGRKIPLIVCIFIQGLASFIASFSPNYWFFLVNWFILALASGGAGIISFVISMEIVGGKWRTIIPIIYQLPFGLGSAVMAGLAYWLRDWRMLELALALLSSLYIVYWFWIPESPKWLIAKGYTDKAIEVLTEAAKINKREFNKSDIQQMLPKAKEISQKGSQPGFVSFLKSKSMRRKTVLLSLNWLCTGLSFYTFAQSLGTIGSNIFVTVAVSGIISTPGPLVCLYVLTRFGRKTTLCIFQAATALCFVWLLVIPKHENYNWIRLICAGVGFAGMGGSVAAMYLYSGELFPTLGRNAGVAGVSTFARIGSMVAPAVANLETYKMDLPIIILSIISFAQIFMLIPLPETKDLPLPDTLEEAENFSK